ncbi:NUDIX domain-containing protein [Candidatus Woesearchaeota archaeon]|nr:NUDIX domain-containing protein [Candidatus Woesearchaeota archaeon]
MTVGTLEEMVKAYTADEKFVGIVTKNEAHYKNYLTWTSQVVVRRTQDVQTQFLLTLRTRGMHRWYVLCWQLGYTETIDANEDAISAGARGAREELGAEEESVRPLLQELFEIHYRNPNDKRDMKNAVVSELNYNGGIIPNRAEIVKVKWVTLAELEQIITAGTVEEQPITPLSIEVWGMYKTKVLGR